MLKKFVYFILLPSFLLIFTTASSQRKGISLHGDGRITQVDLFVMNADGSNQNAIMFTAEKEGAPYWSPDGETIALVSSPASDVYLIKLDDPALVNITNNRERAEYALSWSPDGSMIAFSAGFYVTKTQNSLISTRGVDLTNIYVMNADGSNVVQLTDAETSSSNPAWSPDGTMIAFSRRMNDSSEIFVVKVASGETSRLTSFQHRKGHALQPSWSPDGEFIVYNFKGNSSNSDLYLLEVKSGRSSRLTDTPGNDEYPAWSPDGGKIAFTTTTNPWKYVFVIDSDGSNLTALSGEVEEYYDQHPSWSPDGKQIVFQRFRVLPQPPVRGVMVIYTDGSMEYRPNDTDLPPLSLATKGLDGKYTYREISREEADAILRKNSFR